MALTLITYTELETNYYPNTEEYKLLIYFCLYWKIEIVHIAKCFTSILLGLTERFDISLLLFRRESFAILLITHTCIYIDYITPSHRTERKILVGSSGEWAADQEGSYFHPVIAHCGKTCVGKQVLA